MSDKVRYENTGKSDLQKILDDKQNILDDHSRDTSEKVELEDKLQRSELLFQAAFSQHYQFMAILSPEGVVVEINETPVKVQGFSREDYIGKPFWDAPAWRGLPGWSEIIRSQVIQAATQNEPVFSQDQFQMKNGEIRWADAVYAAIRDGFGEINNIVVQARDITEQKQAEEQLSKQRYYLEKAQELGQIGAWELDIENNTLVWTDENCRIFDVPSGTVVDYEFFIDKVHPEDQEYVKREWSAAMRGKAYDIEHRINVAKGVKWVREKADITFDGNGRAIRAIGFTQDISERKQAELAKQELEARLRQKYKMEAIGTMAGGIAHDFNNLLSIIIGNIALLKKKLRSGGDPYKYIENIEGATERAAGTVKQILAFSRSTEPQLHDVEFNKLISHTLSLLRSTIPTTVEISSVLPGFPVWIKADNTQLHQVLMNLCTNAVHAMDERGKLNVILSLGPLPQDLQTDDSDISGPYAILTVKDTGVGMDKETISKIFDPFFTTKEAGKGTGMGLSVVHGIISQHNGFVSVESTPFVGTEFKVYIPVAEASTESFHVKEERALPGGREKILLVDDEKALIEATTELLLELGYDVTSMTNSQEALSAITKKPKKYDLVVTDQTMPNLSGVILATRLLEINPDLPIILTTGYSSKVTEKEARDIGIRAYLHKPFSNEILAKTVRDVLDNCYR